MTINVYYTYTCIGAEGERENNLGLLREADMGSRERRDAVTRSDRLSLTDHRSSGGNCIKEGRCC
ncbi:hypothetical protein J6590_057638 [Homalodisca vitripennis]|nr:hypothetical protein J6590_057638 [Homalodisca vitripennis]